LNIYETKYILRPQYSSVVSSRLKHSMITPSKFANAHLKTIYFDCCKLSSFNQSADGELKKIKFRFREYINPDSNGAFYSLEVKIRNGISTNKIKYLVYDKLPNNYEIKTFNQLVNDLSVLMKEQLYDIKTVLQGKLYRPTCIVEYKRKRYDDKFSICRYNIDSDITAYKVDRAVRLNSELKSGISCPYYIFETKGSPDKLFPKILSNAGLIRSSFSKYLWAMIVLDKKNKVPLL
jgi:hypothetical protein